MSTSAERLRASPSATRAAAGVGAVGVGAGGRALPVRALSVRALPVEYRVGLVFLLIWVGGVLAGLPVSLPTAETAGGLGLHFFWPLAVAAVLQLGATLVLGVRSRRRGESRDPLVMARLFPLLVLGVFLYFGFKAWSPFVNPVLHDTTYQRADEALAPVLDGMVAVRQAVAAAVPVDVDGWYAWLFFGLFFVALAVHGLVDPPHRQRQLVLGLCLNLWLGGLAYWIAPAEGPFLFRDGVNEAVRDLQWAWHASYQEVRQTGVLPEHYFTAPLGAMPSLHVAHAVFFVLWAAKSARPLLLAFVPVTLWIVVEAPASGWHYLVDLPAGALLAVVSFTLGTRLVRAPGDGDPAPGPGAPEEQPQPEPQPEPEPQREPEPEPEPELLSEPVPAGRVGSAPAR